jgi:arabinoxylan arabinofuranohydrolase
MKRIISILSFLAMGLLTFGQNPISPPGIYIADPAAHVWKDGRLYVYGSLDETTDYYCSHRHHVLSTDNMLDWTLHRDVFASKGANDQVDYSDALLYAPDCQYHDGSYYLYYTLASPEQVEGVAISESPTGPFVNGLDIDLHGFDQIDPALFIDDDGTAYYIWGQFTAKMAKMKPNMMEIDSSTIRDNIVTEKEHFFHEGGFLVKREGIYYFIYAHMGRAGRATCIAYATSDAPMGPYTYGGVIVDNDHSDPAVWNNHGSIVEFKDQWYVFYHRSTHGSVMMRKACVEPIEFNPDGSITEVEMTSQGAGPPLSATSKIDAERACLIYGHVRIEAISENNEALMQIQPQDAAGYKYINFGEGVHKLSIRVKPGEAPGKIDLALGRPWSGSVSTIEVPAKNGSEEWLTLEAPVSDVSGVHELWLRFSGESNELFGIDWLQFHKE